MYAQPEKKKLSFAEMAAVGTSITVSSIPIVKPEDKAKAVPTILDGELSISLSDACKMSNVGSSSSNATASTDGNSTSSVSVSASASSDMSPSIGTVPTSVAKPAVRTANRNPWKMNLLKKDFSTEARPVEDAPTPAESKHMKPVRKVDPVLDSSDTATATGTATSTSGLNNHRIANTTKKEDKATAADNIEQKPAKSELHPTTDKARNEAKTLPPKNSSKKTKDDSPPREKKHDRSKSVSGQSGKVANSANSTKKQTNDKDDFHKNQRNKSQSKKTNNGNKGPVGNGTNSKPLNGNKKTNSQNKSKNSKIKKQTKRKNKSQKKSTAKGSSHKPTPQELAAFKTSAVQQVEYFFSTDELIRNIYLRKQMDVEGYLPAAIVFNFPSVLMFGIPYYELLEALKESKCVDIDVENECIRVSGGEEEFKRWLFPNEDGNLGCPKWIKTPIEENTPEGRDALPVEMPDGKSLVECGHVDEIKEDDANVTLLTDVTADNALTRSNQIEERNEENQ